MDYCPETDRNGSELHPGDRVSFKTYPRGTSRGTVQVSNRTVYVMPDGSTKPALVILGDSGAIYALYSKGTRKLENNS